MSRKYKFYNSEGVYFVSFAAVYWIDVFIREEYCTIFIDTLKHYQKEGRLELYTYCIMPSHIHLMFRDKIKEPEILLVHIKRYSSKNIQNSISKNPQESRKEWILWMLERSAYKTSNVNKRMLWQHHNKPIELWSVDVIRQKLKYIHNNPLKSGFVTQPEHWKYSSAVNYAGGKGMIDVILLE
jgi:putative transposase